MNITNDYNKVIADIDNLMTYHNWSQEDGKQYLLAKYGKKSRHLLTDEQVLEFRQYLIDLTQRKLRLSLKKLRLPRLKIHSGVVQEFVYEPEIEDKDYGVPF